MVEFLTLPNKGLVKEELKLTKGKTNISFEIPALVVFGMIKTLLYLRRIKLYNGIYLPTKASVSTCTHVDVPQYRLSGGTLRKGLMYLLHSINFS